MQTCCADLWLIFLDLLVFINVPFIDLNRGIRQHSADMATFISRFNISQATRCGLCGTGDQPASKDLSLSAGIGSQEKILDRIVFS